MHIILRGEKGVLGVVQVPISSMRIDWMADGYEDLIFLVKNWIFVVVICRTP
jgi:hypothetical protein